MAKRKVIWTLNAQQDRKEILQYWKDRNKSAIFSKKLHKLFLIAIEQIKTHPLIGSPTQIADVRVKTVRDYLIIYKEIEEQLFILAIWDSRRNPEELQKRLET